MRLADFLDCNTSAILAQWDLFASSLVPAADGMDSAGLRDHAAEILHAIAIDLRSAQTEAERWSKSKGQVPPLAGAKQSPAQTHAVLRAGSGFTIRQLVAEYRALRASVLRLWADAVPPGPDAMSDIGRFNEAIDQAIAESVDYYTNEVDRWRALFLGALGHDLRGPLNALLLTSQAISAMTAGTPVSEHTGRLIRSGERMRRLLDDLLDYNRSALCMGVRLEPAFVDLAAICRQELEVLRAALPTAHIEFQESGATEGRWDPSRIRQVVSNLVINAAKHGDGGGTIEVIAHGDDAGIRLSVANTGRPISKALSKELFEPLRRHAAPETAANGDRESLGLGLYIVRQVAVAHGGDVTVDSGDGRTCFTVTLPKH